MCCNGCCDGVVSCSMWRCGSPKCEDYICVANYLLKSCNGRYDQYVVGKRLLVYTEVAAPDMSDNRFPMEDRLETVAKFARLLERSDEDAMDAISQILVILKDSENSITGL